MSQPSRLLRYLRFFGFVMLGSFVCCLVIGLGFAIYTSIWIGRAQQATGQIVGLNQETDEDNNLVYAPVFRFIATDGKSYTITSSVRTNPPTYEVGETVKVLYLESNPPGARVAGFWQLWIVPTILGFIGIAHGTIGIVIYRLTRRHFQRAPVTPMPVS